MENNKNANLSIHTKDEIEYYSLNAMDSYGEFEFITLTENIEIPNICNILGLNINRFLAIESFNPNSEEIINVEEDIKTFTNKYENVYGLVTNIRKNILLIKSIDCLHILTFDPIKKIIALCIIDTHQTLNKGLKKLVSELNLKYNCNPMDLKVCIISTNCSKKIFSTEELEILKNNFNNIEHCISKSEFGDDQVDICKINISTLLDVGLKYENIIQIKNKDFPKEVTEGSTIYSVVYLK